MEMEKLIQSCGKDVKHLCDRISLMTKSEFEKANTKEFLEEFILFRDSLEYHYDRGYLDEALHNNYILSKEWDIAFCLVHTNLECSDFSENIKNLLKFVIQIKTRMTAEAYTDALCNLGLGMKG